MKMNRHLEQHVAVFGESGSGKTVLVSSFYGALQEPEFLSSSNYTVSADDPGQSSRLHGNYLGMKRSGRRPDATRFASDRYSFSVRLEGHSGDGPFDALRVVWHDYPGEWFDGDLSGSAEEDRRLDTFKALLASDVAFLLVDGQRLLDNEGEEERYLKSLFGSFRTGLLALRDDLLEDGKPLVQFPRIWILALSKADLLPHLDVFGFRDLVIEKAAADLVELRRVIEGLVDSPEALAVGEDFALLSSARFEPDRIEVTERLGLDLILPIAAVLPFQRHIRWVEQRQVAAKVVEDLLVGAGEMAQVLVGKVKFAGLPLFLASRVNRDAISKAVRTAARMTGDQLRKHNAAALAAKDHMAAVLTQFQMDLSQGEEDRVLFRSRR